MGPGAGWCCAMENRPGHWRSPTCVTHPTTPLPRRELPARSCILGSFAFSVSPWPFRFACSSLRILARGQWPDHTLIFPFCLSSFCVLSWKVCAPVPECHGTSQSFWLASVFGIWLWQSLEDAAHYIGVWLCLIRPSIQVSL